VPELSVVLPCYNCDAQIDRSISDLSAHLDAWGGTWEIVLIDDGSTDGTASVLRSRADGARVVVHSLPKNCGKGRAVAEGMTQARGACRVFTDADLPYRLDAIDRCADEILHKGRPAVFGNRLLSASDASAQPLFRQWAGRIVRAATGTLLGRRDVDTQCGLKGFSGPLADALFPMLKIDGFLFDAEATLLLTRAGVPISFVPVELGAQSSSTVRFARTGLMTLREAWRLFRIRGERPDLSTLEVAAGVDSQGKANT
jgi:dolichyl-phosphate beta-glucosyltransferase